MKYKVFGRKYQDYQTEVEANDAYEAIDIANQLETHKWFEIESDDVIEATEVYLDEDTSKEIQLNKDEWPEMESGILITGTN